jgi:hypothetical protein
MPTPPTPPTFEWALDEIKAYLAGLLGTADLFRDVSALSQYYRELYPADVPREDELYSFFGTVWGRTGRVLRGKDTEQDLVDLLREWLPDVEGAALRERQQAGGQSNGRADEAT